MHARDESTDDRPEQDRDVGRHLDQRIAAGEFCCMQVLRQDAVFQRTEESRLCSHHEQHGQQEASALQPEADCTEAHDEDLGELDQPDQARLLELVGKLAGEGREQEERQDEDAPAEDDELTGRERGALGERERDEDDECETEDVVVERAEELRREQWQEAFGCQQRELIHNGPGTRSGPVVAPWLKNPRPSPLSPIRVQSA